MTTSHLPEQILFGGIFLAFITIVHEISKKAKFPFTVILLALGFATQVVLNQVGGKLPFSLNSDFIYFVLLPILLFGSAMHINLHQFRLQFKTITFVSTFGLMISTGIIGWLVSFFANVPLWDGLLFGALISATDPIAVLAIFKQLGAPNRLALLADGESMFNDATAVILFRIIASIVLFGKNVSSELVFNGLVEFCYVFLGSIIAGALIGYLISQFIAWVKDDPIVETTLTMVAALMAFVAIEKFLHLSGVISAVVAGLAMGNWGRSRFSASVIEFVKMFWDYLGFLSIAVVFYFSAIDLDLHLFAEQPVLNLIIIFVVLIARAISVYTSYAITNKSKFFKDEPDVPMSWQHILNWGGLRGVIPLVLVYSLPHDYIYRELIFSFTISTFIFTIMINGTTIEWLLKILRLNHPKHEDLIIKAQTDIFEAETALEKIEKLPASEFNQKLKNAAYKRLSQEMEQHRLTLLSLISKEDELYKSLMIQANRLEKVRLLQLFRQGYVNENVMMDFDSQIDISADALEYPEKFSHRVLGKDGNLYTKKTFEKSIEKLKNQEENSNGIFKVLFRANWEQRVIDRYSLLRIRTITSDSVLDYIAKVGEIIGDQYQECIKKVVDIYQGFVKYNLEEKSILESQYPELIKEYRQRTLLSLTKTESGLSSNH